MKQQKLPPRPRAGRQTPNGFVMTNGRRVEVIRRRTKLKKTTPGLAKNEDFGTDNTRLRGALWQRTG